MPEFEVEDKTIRILMSILYEKSPREEQHSQRVSQLCFALANELGLDHEQKMEMAKTGLLHDIGKIAIPTDILNKGGPLSPTEWEEIHGHPGNGYRFLSAVAGMSGAAEAVFAHHERWDGSGYPRQLRSHRIPLSARIVAVADAFDAMISTRPYRRALSFEEARQELLKGAKKQFDPEVVEAFLDMVAGMREPTD